MTAVAATPKRVLRNRGEWRTVVVIVAVYAGWLAVVLGHRFLPWWATAALLAWFGAWHLSLLHELAHGRPFRQDRSNVLVGSLPVTLWIPFRSFRAVHLRHHDSALTVPIDDPESFYTAGPAWAAAGPVRRAVLRANCTMAFRLLVWSALSVLAFVRDELRAAWRGAPGTRRALGEHLAGVAVVVAVMTMSGIPWWLYLLGAVYGARMLNLVRSFAEHRWVPGDAPRTAMVEAGPVMSLLMLNVNLHVAHHAEPWVPWFDIPAVAARIDAAGQAASGAGRYRGGYLEVLRRYAFRPLDDPRYPGS